MHRPRRSARLNARLAADLHLIAGSSKRIALRRAPGIGQSEPANTKPKGNSMAMADDDDELLRSRAEGWRAFSHLLGWVITGAVIVLILMALFLL